MAICEGKWILSSKFLHDCHQHNFVLKPHDYEITASTTDFVENGPTRARTVQRKAGEDFFFLGGVVGNRWCCVSFFFME